MIDITTIPEDELRKDLEDSYADILACKAVLRVGITTTKSGNVQTRLDANNHFVEVISAELARRNKSSVVVIK